DGRDNHHRQEEEEREQAAAPELLQEEQSEEEAERELDADRHDRDQHRQPDRVPDGAARERLPVPREPVPKVVRLVPLLPARRRPLREADVDRHRGRKGDEEEHQDLPRRDQEPRHNPLRTPPEIRQAPFRRLPDRYFGRMSLHYLGDVVLRPSAWRSSRSARSGPSAATR